MKRTTLIKHVIGFSNFLSSAIGDNSKTDLSPTKLYAQYGQSSTYQSIVCKVCRDMGVYKFEDGETTFLKAISNEEAEAYCLDLPGKYFINVGKPEKISELSSLNDEMTQFIDTVNSISKQYRELSNRLLKLETKVNAQLAIVSDILKVKLDE